MATIKDVAHHAQVSVTTVSHVINATRFVSEDSRLRVEAAIKSLKFVRSALARSLKNNRTNTIGMMIPNSSNPYFAEIIRGIEDVCYLAGFNVILCNSDDDPNKQAKYIRVLTEKQIDGLVVMSSGEDKELVKLLRELDVPQVLVDREVEHLLIDLVEVDHEVGGYIAMRHLLQLGHTRIACIHGPLELSSAKQRLEGSRRALIESGIAMRPDLEVNGAFTSQGGHAAMQLLLSVSEPPSAVFASNDLMAIGAASAASSAGIKIPQDLSIIGFDDIALAAYCTPPLTTIVQPKHQLGELAAQIVLERIANRQCPARREILLPTLRVRASTAPVISVKRN